jgi:hypothetical protein
MFLCGLNLYLVVGCKMGRELAFAASFLAEEEWGVEQFVLLIGSRLALTHSLRPLRSENWPELLLLWSENLNFRLRVISLVLLLHNFDREVLLRDILIYDWLMDNGENEGRSSRFGLSSFLSLFKISFSRGVISLRLYRICTTLCFVLLGALVSASISCVPSGGNDNSTDEAQVTVGLCS